MLSLWQVGKKEGLLVDKTLLNKLVLVNQQPLLSLEGWDLLNVDGLKEEWYNG
jgi:hypothetical protein